MKMAIIVLLLIGGIFFFAVGTVGIIRFNDTFERAHAAAKCDTLGAVLSLSALAVYGGFSISSIKLMLAIVLLWITNPVATHIISRAEYRRRIEKNAIGAGGNENI
ncbi:hypothetical protein EAL2_808p03170 (plasmid) [Peptoclostridium acidaminophilum DSM 3953]|uniref:Multisubunit sodium/proton antiporter, MrpG subunit n=1 Tax=Peptoclostridium acidaminophilum DSM 3953 TaxID=1286171 RepID=W8TNT6_PEPAC|nr:monovalent cation/H(+) antiporter subunit G [Peptoclostridium acidaminophilum]AHM57822.1 hypothetical protein EAL2_808p03170 [Peptoclostridium acidaminophilum DSM 3953]